MEQDVQEQPPEPMEVDQVLLDPRAERQRLLLLRKRTVFREKMLRFNKYAEFTRLKPTDCHWPLIAGISPQRKRLCGYAYGHRYPPAMPEHDNNTSPEEFRPKRFIAITKSALYAAGAGPDCADEISYFVFERTMKIVVEYCNFMYDLARSKNKELITSEEVEELISRCKIRQYMYYKNFYFQPAIYPQSDVPRFTNKFSKRIHEAFYNDPNMRSVYFSEEIFAILQQKAIRIMTMHFVNYPLVNSGEDQLHYHTTFVAGENGELSMFAANRFHEALGLPPLETDLITVLSWLAKLVVNEIVLRTLILWQDTLGLPGLPLLHCYLASMRNDRLAHGTDDVLFNLDFNIDHSALPPDHIEFELRPRPLHPDVQSYYTRKEMLEAVDQYRDSFYERHCRAGCANLYQNNKSIFEVTESRKR